MLTFVFGDRDDDAHGEDDDENFGLRLLLGYQAGRLGNDDDNDDGDDDDENFGLRLLSYQAGRQETESTSLRLVGYASLPSTTTDFR